MRVIQARYRQRHREELNAKRRASYWRDIAKTREQQKRWNKNYRSKHREELKGQNAAYRAAHRDKLLIDIKRWRERNLDSVRAKDRERSRRAYASGEKLQQMREWRARNPKKARAFLRASFHKRRTQIANEFFTAADWLALLDRYDGRCAYCGRHAKLTVDHRVPLSRGGRNVIDNILPACKSCNSRKHTKTEAEFRTTLRTESLWLFAPLLRSLDAGPPPGLSEREGAYRAA